MNFPLQLIEALGALVINGIGLLGRFVLFLAAALRYIEAGHARGKVVVTV